MKKNRVAVSALLSLVGPAHHLFLLLAASKCDVFRANEISSDLIRTTSAPDVQRGSTLPLYTRWVHSPQTPTFDPLEQELVDPPRDTARRWHD